MIDLKHLLYSFKGRIGRQYWWLASLAVALLAGMANSLIEIMANVRPRHDRPDDARIRTVGTLCRRHPRVGPPQSLDQLRHRRQAAARPLPYRLVARRTVDRHIGVFRRYRVGVLKGTQGRNRFGPDPLAPQAEDNALSQTGS